MDVATKLKYLDSRILYGEEVLHLYQQHVDALATDSLLQQLQQLKREREELAHIHTPSKNLAIIP